MSRIEQTFARLRRRGEAALVPFLMAGDPGPRDDARAAARGGRGRRRSDRARRAVLRSDGRRAGDAARRACARWRAARRCAQILELVAELRRGGSTMPIVLFGYYNPFFHYGPERLADDAQRAGVDALLVVDLPPEEADELWQPARAAGLDMIFLLAPTSDAEPRPRRAAQASGFVYYVSMTGVTGSKAIDADEVQRHGRASCAPTAGCRSASASASRRRRRRRRWRRSPTRWWSAAPSCG